MKSILFTEKNKAELVDEEIRHGACQSDGRGAC